MAAWTPPRNSTTGSCARCGSAGTSARISRKTMSNPLRGVVVSHAGLAQSLVTAAEHISGVRDALVPVTNEGCDGGSLKERIGEAIGEGPAVVFVDLPGGSCL